MPPDRVGSTGIDPQSAIFPSGERESLGLLLDQETQRRAVTYLRRGRRTQSPPLADLILRRVGTELTVDSGPLRTFLDRTQTEITHQIRSGLDHLKQAKREALDAQARSIIAVKALLDSAGIELPAAIVVLQATPSFRAAAQGDAALTPGGAVRAERHRTHEAGSGEGGQADGWLES